MPAHQEQELDIFDDILNLETNFYNEGFQEGVADGRRAGLREGTEFGIQTGYQRYIALGVLRGRLFIWKKKFTQSNSRHPNIDKILKNLTSLDAMLSEIPVTNSDTDVAHLEALIRKAKSKAKITANLIKDTTILTYYDGTVGLRSTEEAIEDFRI